MVTSLMRKTLGVTCLGLSMACAAPAAMAVGDLLETPARPTELAPHRLLNDVAVARRPYRGRRRAGAHHLFR